MTRKYDELSQKEPIFGELDRIDLAVVAALIFKENLADKAGLALSTLLSADQFPTHKYKTPKQIDSKATVVKAKNSYITSALGGVEINSWGEVVKTELSEDLAPV